MKITLLVCLVMATSACLHKPQPVIPNNTNDSIQPLVDSILFPNPYTETVRIKDSLQLAHERDSFMAIKPLTIFHSDEKGDALDKMIAAMIDTTGFIKTPLLLSDTTIYKYAKNHDLISSRQICKNTQFVIEIRSREIEPYGPRRLYINGHELRPGIELDTSLSGSAYSDNIEMETSYCTLMKFGAKEYLQLTTSINRCNGMGCGVRYYILYDPILRKGMLLEQFRSDFYTGYDKKTHSPVFIDLYQSWETQPYAGGIMFSGKIHRLNRSNHIQRMLDKTGKQFYFRAHSKNFDDTITIFEGNLPTRNQ